MNDCQPDRYLNVTSISRLRRPMYPVMFCATLLKESPLNHIPKLQWHAREVEQMSGSVLFPGKMHHSDKAEDIAGENGNLCSASILLSVPIPWERELEALLSGRPTTNKE